MSFTLQITQNARGLGTADNCKGIRASERERAPRSIKEVESHRAQGSTFLICVHGGFCACVTGRVAVAFSPRPPWQAPDAFLEDACRSPAKRRSCR